MPSKDSNTPEKKDENIVKFKASKEKATESPKKKSKFSLTQLITYLILALLAVVLIVGIFPSFGTKNSGSTSLVFGSYDKTPIEFASGNYFYRQYQSQSQQITENSDSATYQIWRSAFENTVFHTAVKQMAEKAGIIVAENTLNNAIIESGAYNKNGKFDVETYKNATVEYQKQVMTQYSDNIPVQMVMDDLSTILSSPAEIDYILAMGNSARTFDYVVFSAKNYPDDLALKYAQANPAAFTQLDFSIITMSDEAAATALRDEIASGARTFADAAVGNSLDGFAADGGRAGVWYLYELQDNFTDPEQVNTLFSTKAGEISPVFATPAGYAFYKVEAAPRLADFADADVLADVKTYIGAKDAGILTAYLREQANGFAQSPQTAADFATAAKNADVSVVNVGATPANIGNSNYLTGFSYTDSNGSLASLSTNTEVMKNLYSLPVGSVSEPIPLNSSYVVAKITGETVLTEANSSYLRMIYPYLSQSQNQQDLIQSVFTSDKLEDNFLTVFLGKIMGTTTAVN